MHNPPLSQSEQHHVHNPWIWAASLLAVAALLTISGLISSATSQVLQDAEASTDTGAQMVRLVLER